MRNLSPTACRLLKMRLLTLPQLHGALQARMERAVAPFAPAGWCAGVRRADGDTAFAWGGEAIAGRTHAAQDTIFRVASISKVITAAAVLSLEREGKINLDADAGGVLGFPCGFTPRQLLTHTAALTDAAYNRAANAGEFPPLDALLPESRAPWKPGAKFRYSNLGAGVAGMLVEKLSGEPFDEYVRWTFFLPHAIDASFHPQRIAAREKMANCYRVPGGALAYDAQKIAAQPLDETVDPLRHYNVPAGKLMISAPALLETLVRLADDFPALYAPQGNAGRGLGMAITRGVFRRGKTAVGHQGVAYGAVCEAWLCPEDGAAAVFLTNGAKMRSTGALQHIGQNAVAALLDFAYE